MSNLAMKSKKELFSMLIPVIKDWCNCTGYKLPPTNWLLAYTFNFEYVTEYISTYNGKTISVVGTHYSSSKLIVIATARELTEVMSTIVHELAHAVQSFNLPTTFGIQYTKEASIHSHATNKFECQARRCEEFLAMHTRKDEGLVNAMINFIPTFERPVLKEATEEWEYFRPEVTYLNDPRIGKNRKMWWLRR